MLSGETQGRFDRSQSYHTIMQPVLMFPGTEGPRLRCKQAAQVLTQILFDHRLWIHI